VTPSPETKFEPFTVRVKAAPPAAAELGLRLAITGGFGLMVKVAAEEAPALVVTVALTGPAVASKEDGTVVVTCVGLTSAVASGVVPNVTFAPEMKFVPLTVRGIAGLPAVAELGFRPEIVGAGTVIVKLAPDETTAFCVTVTLAVPTLAISAAGTAAVNCVAPTNVVVSEVVPHWTLAPETKFKPFTVRVKSVPPAAAELGLRLAIDGGFGLIVKVAAAEGPALVVTTTLKFPAVARKDEGTAVVTCVALTLTIPVAAIKPAGTEAVSTMLLTKVVVRGVVPQLTIAPEVKLEPVTVKVKAAPPESAFAGLRLVMPGTASIVRLCAPEVLGLKLTSPP
jgi:hypothetical protein